MLTCLPAYLLRYLLRYGPSPGRAINSLEPFHVEASVDHATGALSVILSQHGHRVTAFNRAIGGNPNGRGVPTAAMAATIASQGKLALVASLWSADDLAWLTYLLTYLLRYLLRYLLAWVLTCLLTQVC